MRPALARELGAAPPMLLPRWAAAAAKRRGRNAWGRITRLLGSRASLWSPVRSEVAPAGEGVKGAGLRDSSSKVERPAFQESEMSQSPSSALAEAEAKLRPMKFSGFKRPTKRRHIVTLSAEEIRAKGPDISKNKQFSMPRVALAQARCLVEEGELSAAIEFFHHVASESSKWACLSEYLLFAISRLRIDELKLRNLEPSVTKPMDYVAEGERMFAHVQATGQERAREVAFVTLIRMYCTFGKQTNAEEALTKAEMTIPSATLRRARTELLTYYVQQPLGAVPRESVIGLLKSLRNDGEAPPPTGEALCAKLLALACETQDDEMLALTLDSLREWGDTVKLGDAAEIIERAARSGWGGATLESHCGAEVDASGQSLPEARSAWALEKLPPPVVAEWARDLGMGDSELSPLDTVEGSKSLRSSVYNKLSRVAMYSQPQPADQNTDRRAGFAFPVRKTRAQRVLEDRKGNYYSPPRAVQCLTPEERQLVRRNIVNHARSQQGSHAVNRILDLEEMITSPEGGYTAVIDAANAGYFYQPHLHGRFSYINVEALRRKLVELGEKPLIVIAGKYMDTNRASYVRTTSRKIRDTRRWRYLPYGRELLSDLDFEIRDQWESLGCVYEAPISANDDLYWLYAALVDNPATPQGIVAVTNDRMRDHRAMVYAANDATPQFMRRLVLWQSSFWRFQIELNSKMFESQNKIVYKDIGIEDVTVQLDRSGDAVAASFCSVEAFPLESGEVEWHVPVSKRSPHKVEVVEHEQADGAVVMPRFKQISQRRIEQGSDLFTADGNLWLRFIAKNC